MIEIIKLNSREMHTDWEENVEFRIVNTITVVFAIKL